MKMKVIELETNNNLGTLASLNEVPDAGKRFIWDRFVEKTNYLIVKDLNGSFRLVNPSTVRLEK